MRTKKLSELAELVQGELFADGTKEIYGVADLTEADSRTIGFCADKKNFSLVESSRAGAVVVPLSYSGKGLSLIKVKDPILAITIIHNAFLRTSFIASGVSPQACIADDCTLPQEVSIGAMAVLGQGVDIGERVTIHPGVILQENVVIGDDCVIHPNVTLYAGCTLGKRVIIHSGTVIGSDGFGYVTTTDGVHVKRPHVGTVRIDDDVEIGANVAIDRGTFSCTWIKQGSKIDNLVQIAHNVVVGEHCLVVGQAGIAGSTKLGRNVVLGGQVAVTDHLSIGDGTMVAGQSGVHNNLEAGVIFSGTPAIPHRKWLRASIAFVKLPELVKDIRRIKKQLAELVNNN